jgi:NitT/TauT family transport system substrate-binding protein
MRRRHIALLLSACLLVAVSACGEDKKPAASTADSGKVDQVNIGIVPIVDVAPIYLGVQKGFFDSRHMKLNLTPAQGGAVIVPGVLSGQYQFGFSNVVSLLLAQSKNLPVKVVSNGNNSTGVDGKDFGSVVVKADSPIKSAADLAGKKVAINTLKNISDTVVRASVRKAGGDPAKVSFVELAFPDMGPAVAAGRVDAAFVVEPFQTALRKQGMRSVASSWVDAAPNLTVATYFTSKDLAAKNPDLVKRFTEAMKESLAYADAHADEVRKILSSYTQITGDAAAELTLPKWPADINRASVQTLADLGVTDGLLPTKPDLNALLP